LNLLRELHANLCAEARSTEGRVRAEAGDWYIAHRILRGGLCAEGWGGRRLVEAVWMVRVGDGQAAAGVEWSWGVDS